MIKVDRSVVQGCATDPGRSAVLGALAAYAGGLAVGICAEDFDDAVDPRHLYGIGVTHAQGALVAPGPRPGGMVSAVTEQWNLISYRDCSGGALCAT